MVEYLMMGKIQDCCYAVSIFFIVIIVIVVCNTLKGSEIFHIKMVTMTDALIAILFSRFLH